MVLIELGYNLLMLIALSIISGFLDKKYPRTTITGLIFQGFLFGIIVIIGMARPLIFSDGLIFDGRSVVLSLSALFFGPITGTIAGSIAIIFRLIQGGVGIEPGILVVASSVLIGLVFYYFKKKNNKEVTIRTLSLLGVCVHVIMLLMMFSLPLETAIAVIQRIAIPIMISYPLATILIGKILSDQEINYDSIERIKASEIKYRSFFETSIDAILLTSTDGKILSANPAACMLFGYSELEFCKVDRTDILDINNPQVSRMLSERELTGNVHCELTFTRKDGSNFLAEISSIVFKYQKNSEWNYLIIRDITERKLAEELLRTETDKLDQYFKHSLDLFCIADIDGNFIKLNEQWEKTLGYKLEFLEGKKFLDFVHPDDLQSTIDTVSQLAEQKEVLNFVNRYKTKDGPYRIIEWRSRSKGKFIYAAARDITDRKHAEKEITMLAHALKSINECVSITDTEDKILFVNQAFLDTYGYEENEIIGKQISIVRSSAKIDEMTTDILSATIKGGWQGEIWNKGKNGSEFMINLSTSFINDDNGNTIGLIGVATDITARMKMEAELYEAAELARIGYWEYIVKSHNFVFNDQYYRIIHGSSSDKQGGNIMGIDYFINNLVHPDSVKLIGDKMQKAIETTDLNFFGKAEAKVFQDDRSIRNVSVQFKVQKDSSGNTIRVYGINQDITARKITELKLVEAKESAEQANKIKTEFLAQMSHEIRTPLHIMTGFTSILKDEFPPQELEDAQDIFDGIENAGSRIIRTVDLILNMSELQLGSYDPIMREINLNDVISKLQREYSKIAKDKKMQILFTPDNVYGKILGDEYSITQIFANLIDNAIKYSQSGNIEINYSPNSNGNVVVNVKDTGIGISKEYLAKIFEPFSQEDSGYSRSFDGSGLGLALVKKYCDINSAKITVESKKEIGSTFSVTFEGIKHG